MGALLFSCWAQADETWRVDALLQTERAPVYDLGPNSLEIRTRFGYGLEARRRFQRHEGRQADLELGIKRERFPDARDNDRLFYDAALRTVRPLNHPTWTQFRFAAEARHARDNDHEVYSRLRLAPALRMGPGNGQILQLRARLGYRDQNDKQTFEGYDQREYLLDAMHLWHTPQWSRLLTTMLYIDRRSADADAFSYNEFGFRLAARQRLDTDTDLTARIGLFTRHYDEGPDRKHRRDRRFRFTLDLNKALTPRMDLTTFVGYQANLSTLSIKEYRGVLVGLGLSAGLY